MADYRSAGLRLVGSDTGLGGGGQSASERETRGRGGGIGLPKMGCGAHGRRGCEGLAKECGIVGESARQPRFLERDGDLAQRR